MEHHWSEDVLTADKTVERKKVLEASVDLQALLERCRRRNRQWQGIAVPEFKAGLSRAGGYCPLDRAPLRFNPTAAGSHECVRCGKSYSGERHEEWWARFQHLWLAERGAEAAALAVLADDTSAQDAAIQQLVDYERVYSVLPNRDNILGPSRLFFSTYLESIWVTNYLASAVLLRDAGALDDTVTEAVSSVADNAALIIGDFNEGLSNRQTWHSAALTAIAAWFGDLDLARDSIEGRTGLAGHLLEGFGEDGAWYEGENYHLFALRGLLIGLDWARYLGTDLREEPEIAAHLELALRAPMKTALPDLTFPARKDARFGVSLAQPMYAELWESGRAGLADSAAELCERWLVSLYQAPVPTPARLDSWLHDAGLDEPPDGRRSLSWWMLMKMQPDAPAGEPWQGKTVLLPAQGLAVIRGPAHRYTSLEAGATGGGHGHPDRLQLSLHDGVRHLLPDFGTGEYVNPDLFWYRSTLSHNAPLLDGVSQEVEPASCEMFDQQGPWSWVRARFGSCTRTVVSGPDYLIDVTDLSGADEHEMVLPWHLIQEWSVITSGKWERGGLEGGFIHDAEAFVPEGTGPVVIRTVDPAIPCSMHHLGGVLIRATGPAEPGGPERPFWVVRGSGRYLRFVTVIDLSSENQVENVRVEGDAFEVHRRGGVDLHSLTAEGWGINRGSESWKLTGPVPVTAPVESIFATVRVLPPVTSGVAKWVEEPPALDGTMSGFLTESPLTIDTEDQYRRSEEPWPGEELFSATAWVNWNEAGLFVAVEVRKDDIWFRTGDAVPLDQDNEADDIHSDGLQLHIRAGEQRGGWVVVPNPEDPSLRVRRTAADDGSFTIHGSWSDTGGGYLVTLGILSSDGTLGDMDEVGFDILVNEMRPGRRRRSGQLVWSGGGGWVYLRGDRQAWDQLGVLGLA